MDRNRATGRTVAEDDLSIRHAYPAGRDPGTSGRSRSLDARARAVLGRLRMGDVGCWTHGPIRCTDGQAAVFRALWSFKGAEVDGERIMTRAGQTSDKPIDLFKVKTANKGKPEYEGPLHAYRALVKSNRRQGVYWMPCAAPDFVSA